MRTKNLMRRRNFSLWKFKPTCLVTMKHRTILLADERSRWWGSVHVCHTSSFSWQSQCAWPFQRKLSQWCLEFNDLMIFFYTFDYMLLYCITCGVQFWIYLYVSRRLYMAIKVIERRESVHLKYFCVYLRALVNLLSVVLTTLWAFTSKLIPFISKYGRYGKFCLSVICPTVLYPFCG